MALDVFKLDTIATALKKVDEVRLLCVCMWLGVPCITVIRDTIQDVTRVRKQVTAFDAKQFTNYTDREKVVHLTRNVGEELGLLRAQMRDVLVQEFPPT